MNVTTSNMRAYTRCSVVGRVSQLYKREILTCPGILSLDGVLVACLHRKQDIQDVSGQTKVTLGI